MSFVVIEDSVGGFDCLANLFPLHSRFEHSNELELLEDSHAPFDAILITGGRVLVTNGALIISMAHRRTPTRCRLVHLTVALKWLLHLTGSFLMEYMAVGYSLFHYLLLIIAIRYYM